MEIETKTMKKNEILNSCFAEMKTSERFILFCIANQELSIKSHNLKKQDIFDLMLDVLNSLNKEKKSNE